MKEIKDIIRAYDMAVAAGKKTALATVVHVEGSSYRRPGARMLVTEDGLLTGAISGGCLEGDALRKALLAINEGKNKLVTYDTSDEDDARFGVQLGCNGIVHILFEPILSSLPNNPLQLLKQVAGQRSPSVLVSLFSLNSRSLQPGLCMAAFNTERPLTASGLEKDIQADLELEIARAFAENASHTKAYAGALTAYIEFIQPALSLYICGAGNDAIPLVEAAKLIGFDVTVIDGRQTHATVQRFPDARVWVAKPEQALAQVTVDDRTAFVLMTHNYNYDLEVLGGLMNSDCRYIGVLGPKTKLQRMYDDLEVRGVDCHQANVYSPVGLDIGAETAEEIAISIISEIKAVFSGRTAQHLRDKKTPIHSRTTASS
jgi:xanthine/CO dehydrogenase XdhC/CoxF family maturation factor